VRDAGAAAGRDTRESLQEKRQQPEPLDVGLDHSIFPVAEKDHITVGPGSRQTRGPQQAAFRLKGWKPGVGCRGGDSERSRRRSDIKRSIFMLVWERLS
jgi:hypothetical protein